EVDVDVRWFVALPGDEALEQHAHQRGVDLGHAQGVADHRVGGRAAALAQDPARAGEADDVVDGQEVGLVAQFGDQGEFLLDQLPGLGADALRPAPACAFLDQVAQPAGGVVAGRHQFVRVLVPEVLAQVEAAAPGDADGFGQQVFGVDGRQGAAAAQVALAIGEQQVPGLGHGDVVADRGHGVLQGAPAAHVHVDVAGGDQGQAKAPAGCAQLPQPGLVVGTAVQLDRQPGAAGEGGPDPGGLPVVDLRAGYPQCEQAVGGLEVLAQQAVFALLRPAAGPGDEAAQGGVAGRVLDQEHQLRPVPDLHFAAHDQPHAVAFGGLERADDAGQRALVGDRQGLVAEPGRAFEQLGRDRGAALEAEGGQAVELRVVHQP